MGMITLRQAADWCGGLIDPKYADVTFLGANNDSRIIEPGQLPGRHWEILPVGNAAVLV